MKLVVPQVAIIKVDRLRDRWGVDEACERAALEYVRETPVTLWKYRELANALRDHYFVHFGVRKLDGRFQGQSQESEGRMLNITLKVQTSKEKFTSRDLNELRHSFAEFIAELEELKGQGLKHEIEVTYK